MPDESRARHHSKDIDFSSHGIQARWEAGYAQTNRALAEMPWTQEFSSTERVILREAHAGRIMEPGNINAALRRSALDRA